MNWGIKYFFISKITLIVLRLKKMIITNLIWMQPRFCYKRLYPIEVVKTSNHSFSKALKSNAYNHLTPVHRGMLRDVNLSHLLWKLVRFLTMFYLALKVFLKFSWSVFILLLLNFSRQYQLQHLSDISFPITFTSVWNNCVCYYLPLLQTHSALNYYSFFVVWNQV